jgi:hypothetical protein
MQRMQMKLSLLRQIFIYFSNEATQQVGHNVMIRVFNAGLLARSQFAYGRLTGQLDQGFQQFSSVTGQC